jgi:hypothetical protein
LDNNVVADGRCDVAARADGDRRLTAGRSIEVGLERGFLPGDRPAEEEHIDARMSVRTRRLRGGELR